VSISLLGPSIVKSPRGKHRPYAISHAQPIWRKRACFTTESTALFSLCSNNQCSIWGSMPIWTH
jgi:hypothetical protein